MGLFTTSSCPVISKYFKLIVYGASQIFRNLNQWQFDNSLLAINSNSFITNKRFFSQYPCDIHAVNKKFEFNNCFSWLEKSLTLIRSGSLFPNLLLRHPSSPVRLLPRLLDVSLSRRNSNRKLALKQYNAVFFPLS